MISLTLGFQGPLLHGTEPTTFTSAAKILNHHQFVRSDVRANIHVLITRQLVAITCSIIYNRLVVAYTDKCHIKKSGTLHMVKFGSLRQILRILKKFPLILGQSLRSLVCQTTSNQKPKGVQNLMTELVHT